MVLRKNTVLIGAAAAAAAGIAAWALYGLMLERSASSPRFAASATAPLRSDAQGPVAVSAAASAALVAPIASVDRFKLVGVMLNGKVRIALITVDGKPTQMFRVGETVDGNLVVRDVSERGASLGLREGGAAMAIEMSQASPLASVAATVPMTQAVPQASLADGSVQSQDVLRTIGSKHPPLVPQTGSVPQKPADGPVAPVDDGRWRPPGQP